MEELRPGRSGPASFWIDPRCVEDLPHGGGADLVAESGEFAVDAPVAPRRILGGQAHDQGTDARGNGGATRPSVRGGPAASDELAVPAQNRGRSDEEVLGADEQAAIGRGRRSRRGRSNWSAVVVCVAAGRPVDGVGRGSRSRWRCRSGRAAPSSSAASRTSGRASSLPRADHAVEGSATKRQVRDNAQRFGHPHDRGYGEARVDDELHELGVRTETVIPRKGKPGKARQAHQRRRAFRRTVKWRTGSEARISTLKRGYGWDRARLDDLEGARIWTGHEVLAHNLVKIAALAAYSTAERRSTQSASYLGSSSP